MGVIEDDVPNYGCYGLQKELEKGNVKKLYSFDELDKTVKNMKDATDLSEESCNEKLNSIPSRDEIFLE